MTQPADKHEKMSVGRFGAPFGVRGWIKVNSFTDPIENILNYQPWWIHLRTGWKSVLLENSQIHGNGIVVKIPECNDRDMAKVYTNIDIAIEPSQLPTLKKGEYYWKDLQGLQVINQKNVNLGLVEKLLATGANDVLVVKGDRERLIPYIKNVVLNVDLKEKKILVDWDEDF